MELALSYGYPIAIIFFLTTSILVYKTFKNIFQNKSMIYKSNYFEKAWWTSTFCFLVSQIFDIQYFDARISIICWILFAGLKTLIEETIDEGKNDQDINILFN